MTREESDEGLRRRVMTLTDDGRERVGGLICIDAARHHEAEVLAELSLDSARFAARLRTLIGEGGGTVAEMVESYLAPESLVEARRRVDRRVAALAEDGLRVVELGSDLPTREIDRLPRSSACVVSEFRLWTWSRDDLELLARAVGSSGVLLFLEPTADFGWRRLGHRVLRSTIRGRLGHDFEADIPASLRASGLIVGTADRFGLGPSGLRSYVWGRAERIEPPPRTG